MDIAADGSLKNTLTHETDDHADSGLPRELRTQPDDEGTLSRAEADVAGITLPVYGDDDLDPNGADAGDR